MNHAANHAAPRTGKRMGARLHSQTRSAIMERRSLVFACDYRGEAIETCSCGPTWHCGAGLGDPARPNEVPFAKCLECVAGDPSSSPFAG